MVKYSTGKKRSWGDSTNQTRKIGYVIEKIQAPKRSEFLRNRGKKRAHRIKKNSPNMNIFMLSRMSLEINDMY